MIQYREAWRRLYKELEKKTNWGRNELKELMLKILMEEGE